MASKICLVAYTHPCTGWGSDAVSYGLHRPLYQIHIETVRYDEPNGLQATTRMSVRHGIIAVGGTG